MIGNWCNWVWHKTPSNLDNSFRFICFVTLNLLPSDFSCNICNLMKHHRNVVGHTEKGVLYFHVLLIMFTFECCPSDLFNSSFLVTSLTNHLLPHIKSNAHTQNLEAMCSRWLGSSSLRLYLTTNKLKWKLVRMHKCFLSRNALSTIELKINSISEKFESKPLICIPWNNPRGGCHWFWHWVHSMMR